MSGPTPEPTVVVGKVTRSHGLKGELSVLVLSDNPNRFDEGSSVFTEGGRELVVQACRRNGARLLVTFQGVVDRTAADALRGTMLVVPVSMLPDLEPGEFWPHQLEGCEVVTESGRSLGRLTDVIPNPTNDIWVVVDDDGTESLLPAISQVISDVDLKAARVLVKDIAGLTAPDE